MSAQEEAIINYIAENGRITSRQLMVLLNVKKRRAQIILGKLIDDGVICKKGASRSTCYVFNDALSGT